MNLLDNLLLGSGLDTLRGRAVDVVVGDPALVVGLASGGDANGLGAGEGGVGVNDLLGSLGAGSGRLGALGLGEERFDPGLVNEVESSGECGGQDNVEEDAGGMLASWISYCRDLEWMEGKNCRMGQS